MISRSLVESLLLEKVEEARYREAHAFDELAAPLTQSIVLFGAGGLGRRALAGLRYQGIQPVAFSDNNPKLWSTQIDGLQVLSPAQAALRFGKTAVFVITIWGALAQDRMSDRERQLRSLGCDKVVPFGFLFWKYPEYVLPHYGADVPHKVLEQRSRVVQAFDLWADENSRREYFAQLRWRLFLDFEGLPAAERETIYFPRDLFGLHPDEVFVDCGAFNGDTIRLFLKRSSSSFQKIVALEPDPVNFARLRQSVESLPTEVRKRIDLHCAAVGAVKGRVQFSAEGGPSSFVGSGDLQVEAVRLDDLLNGTPASFIKMDIEGAELDALMGASAVIRRSEPLLAISCYHRQDHLWKIPLLIHTLNPNYRLFLRAHDVEMWDLVCYGIPRSRLQQ